MNAYNIIKGVTTFEEPIFYTVSSKAGGKNLRDLHSCPKPVELFRLLVMALSKRDTLVVDPFGGSGTTMIAADAAGRVAQLIEKTPAYCDVIVERWEELTGGKAVRAKP